jgi:acyl-CoA dehydrogenase
LRGAKAERLYREVKVAAIGAGTEEIMKELASRQMGI